MKVLIFGTGQYYKDYSTVIYEHDEVVGLLDNNPDKWNMVIDGVTVFNPDKIKNIGIEYDKIILLSAYDIEMYKQLAILGIPSERLMFGMEYLAQFNQDKCELINWHNPVSNQKKILIVTTELNYNGGTLAAIYMAMALKKIGYYAVIASPKANNKLIGEYVEQGLSFIIRPSLPYVKKEDLKWVDDFDFVFTNVLQMIQCACEISRIKPTVWWLHESSDEYSPIYHNTIFRFQHYAYMTCYEKINIFAVSNIARNNFNKYFPNAKVGILTYGIPDKMGEATIDEKKDKIVFAAIGSMERVKAQDIFVEAADKLNCAVAEFWIIGKNHHDDYCQKVCSMADKNSSIRILGEMTRKQMDELYRKIDVVVCSSREETMSITTTEGMMYGKTCIVTNRAGMAEYVDDGKNGFTFESGNSDDLCAKMKWCVENRNQLNVIGQNARKTYEEFFTIEKFGERLENIIENL